MSSSESIPTITIEYCTGCKWLLRAAWYAQELLSTFENDLGGVTLVPGIDGIFRISCDGKVLWDRKEQGRFPEAKEIKRILRDRVEPDRDLGHIDRPASPA